MELVNLVNRAPSSCPSTFNMFQDYLQYVAITDRFDLQVSSASGPNCGSALLHSVLQDKMSTLGGILNVIHNWC